MYKNINGEITKLTPEEIAQREAEAKRFEAQERHRPLTEQEVTAMFIRQNINALAVNDQTAVRMRQYYPEWTDATAYEIGCKVQCDGKLFKCRTKHTAQPNWKPGTPGTENLWEIISEQYAGDQYDPIPYDGNMVLEKGKFYTQDSVMYECTRDTGNAVFHPLAELVGIYVKAASV